ncbi:hypothetical protein HS088_TW09G00169 [Tripterygium wilfordii]|uniref:Uncharacterized protein n=1 Tax=Tripterygium wilfordii TaxID=458696 RepID=A0A7J7D6Z3_TRIWF|nr:hypothetical protein HS088_TW09G00169 [Tripterygium wilfordii]
MGAMLSKFFFFSSKESKNDQRKSTAHQAKAFSIIELVKPECLKTKKKIIKKEKNLQNNNPQERSKAIGKRKLTLEDMLLASPGSKFKPNHINGSGELYVFKHFSKRVHPSSSSSSSAAASSKAIAKVKIGDEILAYKEDMVTTTSTCTSMDVQSGKLKKKVSFKLPEEADIFTYYYSSEEKLENYSV